MIKMTTTNVYSVKGEVSGTIEVPAAFNTEYRPDIIKKAHSINRFVIIFV